MKWLIQFEADLNEKKLKRGEGHQMLYAILLKSTD
jgi:hypothetical protein